MSNLLVQSCWNVQCPTKPGRGSNRPGKGVYYFIKGKGADVSINIRRVDTDFNYQAYVSIKRIEADLSLEWRKLYISIEG